MRTSESESDRLGLLAVLHAGLLLLVLSWGFGGMSETVRKGAAWLLLPGPLLTFCSLRALPPEQRKAAWWILGPLGLLAILVLASLFNPSRTETVLWGSSVLRPRDYPAYLPNSPRPSSSLADFAFNAGLWLCGINLMLSQARRILLRRLLWVIALNGLVLACVGTIFHLNRATDILGRVSSPNPHFFATFIYHNHWGAFALLSLGAVLGLVLLIEKQSYPTSVTRTPVPFLGLAALALFISIPLSSARASTAATLPLLAGFAVIALPRLKKRFSYNDAPGSTRRRILIMLVALCTAGFGLSLAWETWGGEWRKKTGAQIDALLEGEPVDARLTFYRDTLRLIEKQPLFGWGWQSFQYVYPEVQSPIPRMQARIGRYAVLDAHNDWLQCAAEVGLAGFACLVAAFAGCLRWGKPWANLKSSPQQILLLAIASLGALAAIDFPLACPAVVALAAVLTGTACGFAHRSSKGLRNAPPGTRLEVLPAKASIPSNP